VLTEITGNIFNIQRFCLHDGPGLRTTVFLKGCPLNCLWCSNPESINGAPELGFDRVRCDCCGKCVDACRENALKLDPDGFPVVDRQKCTACGRCVECCFPEALAIYGKRCTLSEVVRELRRDEGFFGSDGGITISGGEPLLQPSFTISILTLCKEAGLNTCIETSGYCRQEVMLKAAAYSDTILFDLKHMENEEHRKLTGKPNTLPINNARIAVSSGAIIQFRMPIVPTINDQSNNITATAKFVRQLQKDDASIELMPYHRLGIGKYQALDRTYSLEYLRSAELEQVEKTKKHFEEAGVRCLVSK